MLTVKVLQDMRSDINFDLFWDKVEMVRNDLDVEEATLPRKRKAPQCYRQGTVEPEFHDTVKDFYRQLYFEAIDLAVISINDRFDQPGFKVYSKLE